LPERWGAVVLVPAALAMAVTPLMFTWVHSTTESTGPFGRRWLGPYFSPYRRGSIEQRMGDRIQQLKRGARETYFDASGDERTHGFLSEMLLFGGSVFTLTPSRYERTGVGYRLSQDVVGARLVQNGRMAQLRPGAAEDCECRWYYSRPEKDMAFMPTFVRARFAKLVAESTFVRRLAGMDRVLYSIERPTRTLDHDIDRYWRPRAILQPSATRGELVFYDYHGNRVITGAPAWLRGELAQIWTGRFVGSDRPTLLLGRARDTDFRLGRRIVDLVEQSNWGWSMEQPGGGWSSEYDRWGWNGDAYDAAHTTRTWYTARGAPSGSMQAWVRSRDRRCQSRICRFPSPADSFADRTLIWPFAAASTALS
jgi:hypothetical protein